MGTVALKARPEVVADAYVDGRVDAQAVSALMRASTRTPNLAFPCALLCVWVGGGACWTQKARIRPRIPRAKQDADELYHTNSIAAIPLMLYELRVHSGERKQLVENGADPDEDGTEASAAIIRARTTSGGVLLPSRLLTAVVFAFVNRIDAPHTFAPGDVRIIARACALLEPTVEYAFSELSDAAGTLIGHPPPASAPPAPTVIVQGDADGGTDLPELDRGQQS